MRSVRRNTELGLLFLGTLVVVGAYILASLAQDSRIPSNIGPFLAVIIGIQLVGHFAIRRFAPNADGMLLPLASLLNGLGYVFIVRLDEAHRHPGGLAPLQATWAILGMGAFVGTLVLLSQSRTLERYRYTAGLIGLGLLMLPLVPGVGQEINGSRIWVSLGPVNFQPGEFAKLALAVFFAGYLVDKRELLAVNRAVGPFSMPDPKHLGPVLVAWGASLVIMISQRDLGSSLLFFTLFIVLVWVATERASYLVVGTILFALGATFSISQFDHVQNRVDIWRDPWADADDKGFQIVQSAYAMADGGIVGRGINLGTPDRIPYAETDFIFAAITEELGLLGATAILMAFLLFIGAGFRIAMRSSHGFDKLLAVGLTTLLGFQAFIIIAGVVRLLPLTGVTLPFVSYGGSSLLANYVLLALLLRISDNAEPKPVEATEAVAVTA
ncbi:MAG TPA: FtsW/RodA/SpoVE family cell cycle protein [Acidimicrobiales bacterium]|jgi:peptidoglycan glycosyltransferase